MSRIALRIARGEGGEFVEFEIGTEGLRTLLDALELIRGRLDPGLRYRHSCHHGSCGTCGALVDGRERLMCLTPLDSLGSGPVALEPLRKMARLADIAVSPAPLFRELPPGSGYLRASEVAHRAPRPADGTTCGGGEGAAGAAGEPGAAIAPGAGIEPGAAGWTRLENCVECGLCVSACPVEAPFVGPAALAAADRDRAERPADERRMLAFAAGPRGVVACERRFACSRACPMGVAPGRLIENLRRSLGKP